MSASNEQVQQFADERVRPICEKIRALKLRMEDMIASIDDVYANLNDNPTWEDSRLDHPARQLAPSDILGIHAFVSDVRAAMNNHGQLPVVLKACVRPVDVE